MTAFFASCPKGLEYLLRDELVALGASGVRETLAGVHFEGSIADAYRACLWSRLASRVLLPVSQFDAADEQALYDGIMALDWSTHMAAHASLAVDAHTTQSKLNHSQFIAQRVKDAVVDQFRQRDGRRPDVDTDEPDLRIHVRIRRDQVHVAIDLAGAPLHRRGWREQQGEAPLKENLAAAILLRGRWPQRYAEGGSVLDPMCGSGTLLIEAALMAADVAPGLRREYFGFLGWQQHDIGVWKALLDEARERAEEGLRRLRPCVFGSDADGLMIQTAKRNAQAAGVAGFIQLERREIDRIQPPEGAIAGSLVVTNPPYGERLGASQQMPLLYRTLGEVLRERFGGWSAAILAGDAELADALRLAGGKRYTLYNGALETVLLLADMRPADAAPRELKPLSENAQMLKNRLEKSHRHLRKRLQREAISCWRAYDQDLPQYAAAIDVYTERNGRRWLHVQEYRAPAEIPPETALQRLRELVRVAGEVLDVARDRIVLKTRQRGKGGGKYGQFDQRGQFLEVEESGLNFLVNLTDYLDTGLFLDHRLVRQRIRELASGRRCLNLFAYTGTASVYAAAGQARSTTSVDLSATYLDWASRNLALNGYTGESHRLVQADAMKFLASGQDTYGLIYVDPPTFSNSKRAADFDVQRDHVALLQACRSRLGKDAVIVFSNNFRRFQLDRAALDQDFEIEDWSAPSIPFDFSRRDDIHGCWLLRPRKLNEGLDPWAGVRLKK